MPQIESLWGFAVCGSHEEGIDGFTEAYCNSYQEGDP